MKNKIVLITGASSGIGKASAELFSEKGAIVILTARHLDKLQILEHSLKKKHLKADSFKLDITNGKQVSEVIKKVISKYKKIDVLVNSAGIARWGSILDVTHEDFNEQVQINLIGNFNIVKEVVPHMVQEKDGCIVNIITSTVKNTKAKRVAYAASKYGQAGLSNAIHEDLNDKGIRVTAIYPGKTNTPIHDLAADDPAREQMLDPNKVAELIVSVVTRKDNVKEVSINPE